MRDVDGSTIGDLAPANVIVVKVELDPEERDFYEALYTRSKLQVTSEDFFFLLWY